MRVPCIKCKGRNPSNCGRTFCPIIAKSEAKFKVEKKLKEDWYGSSPAPFIGRFGYPHINVGILSPPEPDDDVWLYDAPQFWASQGFEIPRIANLRSSLVNSRFKSHIKNRNNQFLDIGKEVGMASKPVDVEINLEKKPHFRFKADGELAPMGPAAKLKKAKITSNPKVHTKVDKVVDEKYLKAVEAVKYLYKSGFDENFLTKILSVGALGVNKNRKLVPTRFSITAVDDMLGKAMLDDIKKQPEINEYKAYFGSYLGNYYLIIMFPDCWGYELFETYLPNASWNTGSNLDYATDHEFFRGRKTYASNCAGGYYATRLGIIEEMKKMKRQGSVLALRFITGEYAMPLGVWVVREATRKAMESKPINFSDKSLVLKYAKLFIKKKFGVDIDFLLKESKLLNQMKKQMKLRSFF